MAACGAARAGAVCRELTKIHEQIVHGTLEELAAAAADGAIPARGEFVLVVGAASDAGSTAVPDADSLRDALAAVEELVATGSARGDAARRVAAATGIPRRKLYEPGR